jgi:hypothetical protein
LNGDDDALIAIFRKENRLTNVERTFLKSMVEQKLMSEL